MRPKTIQRKPPYCQLSRQYGAMANLYLEEKMLVLKWANKGSGRIMDLHNDGRLMSFMERQEKYDIPSRHFFKFLQIKHLCLFLKTTHLTS